MSNPRKDDGPRREVERDHFQAALHLMRDAFAEVLQRHYYYRHGANRSRLDELNAQFFDGYEQAKRLFGTASLKKEIIRMTSNPRNDDGPRREVDRATTDGDHE